MLFTLILKSKEALKGTHIEPLAKKAYCLYLHSKKMLYLKNNVHHKNIDLKKSIRFLNEIQPTKFSSIKDAKRVILITEKGDLESLGLLLRSLIFYKKNIDTAVLINFDLPANFIEEYRLIHIPTSERKNSIKWASNLVQDIQFVSLIYFKCPLVPLNDIINEIAIAAESHKNSIMVGKIVDNGQKIISAGHTLNGYGEIISPYVNCLESDPEVMYCRPVDTIENDFFVISKEVFLSLPESLIDGSNFHLKLSLYVQQNELEIMYTPFIPLLAIKVASEGLLEISVWESIIQLHELKIKILIELHRRTEQIQKKKKIVFVELGIPKPDQDTASVSHVWYLQILTTLGFEVTYIAAFTGDLMQKYCDPLYRLGIKIISARSGEELQYYVTKELSENSILFFCRSFVGNHIASHARSKFPKLKIVFNTVDLDFLRKERHAVQSKDSILLKESLIARCNELNLLKYVDETLVTSSFEMELLKQYDSMASIRHIRLPYLTSTRNPDFDETNSIIFLGGFGHRPNVDSILYFVSEVWPVVHKLDPSIELVIAGSNCTKEISDLASEATKIKIVGFVDQIEDLIQQNRISIAPLLYGAGVKGKVIQSLSLGIPVVASTIAAEGTGLVDGLNILVSDTPSDMAEKIVLLYNNKSLWESLQKMGKQFVESEHSPDRTHQLFKEILK